MDPKAIENQRIHRQVVGYRLGIKQRFPPLEPVASGVCAARVATAADLSFGAGASAALATENPHRKRRGRMGQGSVCPEDHSAHSANWAWLAAVTALRL